MSSDVVAAKTVTTSDVMFHLFVNQNRSVA